MMSDDELRAELGQLADEATIEPAPLDRVQARGRRRTLYQRGGMVLAAFALVVGGTVVVTSMADDDGMDVATDEADTTSTDDPSEADGEDATAADDADGTDDTAEEADDSAQATTSAEAFDVAFDEGFYAGPQRVVPWGDGFLAFGDRYVESESAELIFDGSGPIGEYFSQEIIDIVADSGVTTIEEAMEVLDDAGLLEEATAIVQENPEVLDWYNTPAGVATYVPFVEYSDDGETWEPIDGFAWPGANTWYPQAASNGTHLVVAEHQSEWDPVTGRSIPSPMLVHTTTDLSTWTTVEVPYSVPSVPDFVQLDVSPQQLVLTDDSWLLAVSNWQWIDIWSALPDDVLDEMNRNGYDVNPTEAGIELVDWGWEDEYAFATEDAAAESSDAAASDDVAGEDTATTDGAIWEETDPTVVRTIPWSDVPFTYEDYTGVGNHAGGIEAFLGDLDSGSIAQVDAPGEGSDLGQVVVTDAGLFTIVREYPEFDSEPAEPSLEPVNEDDYRPTVTAWFSPDGRTWQPRELPATDRNDWIDSAIAVDDGILLTLSAAPGGQRFMLGAADGTGFIDVDGPDVPQYAYVWFPTHVSMGDGAAAVVDLGHASQPFFPTYDITYSHDGYEITVTQDAEGHASMTVVDGGGQVVWEHAGHAYDGGPLSIAEYGNDSVSLLDEAGEVVVSIPLEVMEREVWRVESEAWDEYHRENPYVPDFWLVATRDGQSWISMQLPTSGDEYGWYGDAVVSGDRVLVADGMGNWQSVPLS